MNVIKPPDNEHDHPDYDVKLMAYGGLLRMDYHFLDYPRDLRIPDGAILPADFIVQAQIEPPEADDMPISSSEDWR